MVSSSSAAGGSSSSGGSSRSGNAAAAAAGGSSSSSSSTPSYLLPLPDLPSLKADGSGEGSYFDFSDILAATPASPPASAATPSIASSSSSAAQLQQHQQQQHKRNVMNSAGKDHADPMIAVAAGPFNNYNGVKDASDKNNNNDTSTIISNSSSLSVNLHHYNNNNNNTSSSSNNNSRSASPSHIPVAVPAPSEYMTFPPTTAQTPTPEPFPTTLEDLEEARERNAISQEEYEAAVLDIVLRQSAEEAEMAAQAEAAERAAEEAEIMMALRSTAEEYGYVGQSSSMLMLGTSGGGGKGKGYGGGGSGGGSGGGRYNEAVEEEEEDESVYVVGRGAVVESSSSSSANTYNVAGGESSSSSSGSSNAYNVIPPKRKTSNDVNLSSTTITTTTTTPTPSAVSSAQNDLQEARAAAAARVLELQREREERIAFEQTFYSSEAVERPASPVAPVRSFSPTQLSTPARSVESQRMEIMARVAGGQQLSREEASWLREHLMEQQDDVKPGEGKNDGNQYEAYGRVVPVVDPVPLARTASLSPGNQAARRHGKQSHQPSGLSSSMVADDDDEDTHIPSTSSSSSPPRNQPVMPSQSTSSHTTNTASTTTPSTPVSKSLIPVENYHLLPPSQTAPYAVLKSPTTVSFTHDRSSRGPSSFSVISNHPLTDGAISAQFCCYYEVTLLTVSLDHNPIIAIGLATSPFPDTRVPGWHPISVSFLSTGERAHCTTSEDEAARSAFRDTGFGVGDTVGCGYIPALGTVFFTLNGEWIGDAFSLIDEEVTAAAAEDGSAAIADLTFPFHAIVGATNASIDVAFNFGVNSFRFSQANEVPISSPKEPPVSSPPSQHPTPTFSSEPYPTSPPQTPTFVHNTSAAAFQDLSKDEFGPPKQHQPTPYIPQDFHPPPSTPAKGALGWLRKRVKSANDKPTKPVNPPRSSTPSNLRTGPTSTHSNEETKKSQLSMDTLFMSGGGAPPPRRKAGPEAQRVSPQTYPHTPRGSSKFNPLTAPAPRGPTPLPMPPTPSGPTVGGAFVHKPVGVVVESSFEKYHMTTVGAGFQSQTQGFQTQQVQGFQTQQAQGFQTQQTQGFQAQQAQGFQAQQAQGFQPQQTQGFQAQQAQGFQPQQAQGFQPQQPQGFQPQQPQGFQQPQPTFQHSTPPFPTSPTFQHAPVTSPSFGPNALGIPVPPTSPSIFDVTTPPHLRAAGVHLHRPIVSVLPAGAVSRSAMAAGGGAQVMGYVPAPVKMREVEMPSWVNKLPSLETLEMEEEEEGFVGR